MSSSSSGVGCGPLTRSSPLLQCARGGRQGDGPARRRPEVPRHVSRPRQGENDAGENASLSLTAARLDQELTDELPGKYEQEPYVQEWIKRVSKNDCVFFPPLF